MNSATHSLPWYREPWPWILMSGPFLVVVAAMVSLWLAVSTFDGLVTDDYYKEGTTINRVFVRDDRARAMGLEADATMKPEGGRLEIALRATEGVTLPAHVRLVMAHPTRNGFDRSIALDNIAPGRYVGVLAVVPPAHWQFTLEDDAQTWRLVGRYSGQAPSFPLRPAH